MAGWRIAFLSAAALTAALGCRRSGADSADPSAAGATEGGAPAAALDENETVGAQEKSFAELSARLRRSTEPLDNKLKTLRVFIQNAKRIEGILGKKLAVVQRAENEIGALVKAQEDEARSVFQKLESEVNALLEGPAADLDRARKLADEFPVARQRDAVIAPLYEELQRKLLVHARAREESSARLEMAKTMTDPTRIIAYLEGFDPEFDRTPYAEEVRKVIRETYAKYADGRKSRLAAIQSLKWEDVDLEQSGQLWPSPASYQTAVFDGGELAIGPNPADYAKEDDMDLAKAAGTCVQIGEDTWIDYELQFEGQVINPAGVFFGGRKFETASGNPNFHWKCLTELKITDSDWHKFLVRVEGKTMMVTDVTGKQLMRHERLRDGSGSFGIRVTGDRAVFRMRKVQVAVKSEEGAAAESEDAGDVKKGAGRKGSSKKGEKKKTDKDAKDEKKGEKEA